MSDFSLTTPGKINLYLEVKGKQAYGYHELLTLFYPVSLSDRISLDFDDSAECRVICSTSGVPLDRSNLVVKAAQAYFAALQRPCPGMTVRIEKTLPVAGGMGGGSSDAGAVFRLLQKYTNHALGEKELAEAALLIGADVPFFLNPIPSWGRGRGEQLVPAKEIPSSLPLLIVPGTFPISAKWAYQHWCGTKDNPEASADILVSRLLSGDYCEAGKHLRNDLAPAAIQKFPVLQMIHSELKKSGGMPLLSGSGPTLFALYSDFESRDRAYDLLLPFLQARGFDLLKTS